MQFRGMVSKVAEVCGQRSTTEGGGVFWEEEIEKKKKRFLGGKIFSGPQKGRTGGAP